MCAKLSAGMALSEMSAAVSLRGRLARHEPDCNGLVPEEMVRGTIAVTMLVVIFGWRPWWT